MSSPRLTKSSLLNEQKRVLMDYKNIAMTARKKIALVAHDNKKQDLFAWAKYNRSLLERHSLYATGTTGRILAEELQLKIVRLESGQLGGDQQIGAKIAEGEVDFVIFFWAPAGASAA